ncbi:A-kinase anchor protein SPHKAP isoform X2 [Suncus etruscus]|uniref:A-kinase anchor protein SPHKAP isoform X2 n=1 Tax=Suncus etruscus TaxID=109475 RepID=UPI00210FAABE|nr:A-kinase anchor protein SPHKAP isoform X2 [Suncus etruscus]
MDGNSLLAVPSTLESPLMQEALAAQSVSTTNSPAGSLGNSITACKKVLRSNSLLESTDYWLQNQRTPCQIGFVEDKSENCASVCFVNLDVDKDACSTEHLQQKLVNVSPELPKLINSMNVQQPKENEIVLLSGLASGNLQADFEVSQCPWLPDICLVQCARGNRANSTNCIIFEINKFLIGLELVQERQLHLETKVLKVEDDTNCSLSSIEEDFLTASEHLEEESEVEEYRSGYENINVSVNVTDSKKQKEAPQEEWDYNKEKSPYTLEEKYIRKYHKPMSIKEGSLDNRAEDRSQQSLDLSARSTEWKEEHAVNERLVTNSYVSEKLIGPVKKSKTSSTPGDAYVSRMVKKDGPSACGSVPEGGNSSDARACEEERTALFLEQDGEATTGEYATNLAESVLQDAFIRLSQSHPTGIQESAGNARLSNNYSTKDIMVPRSWNELPKIVIVQSPDGGDAVPEPGSSSWSELEVSMENNSVLAGDNASTRPQSALEVALACAATVIGTISSPQATERLKMEQESLVTNDPPGDNELLPTQTSQVLQELSISEYSFPSALCGMTQVASAVAVCGLGETEVSPMASNELFATEPPGAVTPLCSLATENSTELGNKEAIAEALFKETTQILTKPHAYSNMGDLMESMTKRITESASKPHTLCSENDNFGNELAQTLSNAILKHSIDEVYQKIKVTDANDSSEALSTLLETTNKLLFNVICVTFKKMSNIMQSGTCPISLCKESISWRKIEMGCQSVPKSASQVQVNNTEYSSVHPFSDLQSSDPVTNDPDDEVYLKQDTKGQLKSGLFKSPKLQSEFSYSNRVPDSLTAKLSHKEPYQKSMGRKDPRNHPLMPGCNGHEIGASSDGEDQTKLTVKGSHTSHCVSPVAQEKHNCGSTLNHEVQVNLSLLGSELVLPTQAMLPTKHTDLYYITDFAEELAETIVSMATEIAAICLDNSNGKQPWFCAWRRRNELLVAPSASCRSLKRKKDSQSGSGATVRKHKPPRLSEIKRKTDEHPELKEKLMNRVESMNLEDVPDSVNVFANEVAAKIMNLTEFSMVDGVWQAQSYPRNRLLSGDRWNRLKASSCESIPEEESQAKGSLNSPGYMSTLSQPVSRASSVSKQSSCESISEEFSRFMVNQMESEGRGFELLLDYYAGKNASSILNSAIQQACRHSSDHLNVRSNCPSKQSSTESITEEFYRYMLRDMEREYKDSASSRRSSHDWTASLLSSSLRLPQCYRQSSMPDSRSLDPRLAVNAPIKANSLDGFAQNSSQDLLCVQPVSGSSSDSCLYRRGGTDQITTMLIHETWANSIEALMRKNKIIMDEAEGEGAEPNSPLQGELGTPGHSLKRGRRGSNLVAQESMNLLRKDSVAESKHPPLSSLSKAAVPADHKTSEARKEPSSCCEAVPLSHSRRSLCPREVPLIQIETHQRGEGTGESEGFISKGSLEDQKEHFHKRLGAATCPTTSDSLETRDVTEAEVSTEGRGPDEFPNTLGSSGESTDSWSQLANEEDNPDDTSSFLQLSERSMSNGNSSATSSLGIMDLDIYQDNMPSSPMINELVEEKESLKGQSEHIEEHVPGLPVGAASCQGSLLVINFDLEPECPDAELRATLQWIAASELGIPTIYFKKSQENRIEKFLDVVRLVHRKSWKVGDIFHAVVQYCKIHEEQKERIPSLFDWLLELG